MEVRLAVSITYNDTSEFTCSMDNHMRQVGREMIFSKEPINSVAHTAFIWRGYIANQYGELMWLRFGWMEMLNPFQTNISEFLSKKADTSDNLSEWEPILVTIF